MKNPKECVCIQQKQTFFILNELAKPECKDGSEPLLFHHDTFSRFRVVIINAEKKPATANISVKEIPGIIQKIQNLGLKQLLSEKTGKTDTKKSAAYTTVITSGKLKGKTPAVALNESEAVNKPLLVLASVMAGESEELAATEPGTISKKCGTDKGYRRSIKTPGRRKAEPDRSRIIQQNRSSISFWYAPTCPA